MKRACQWLEQRTGAASSIKRFFLEDIPASSSWPQVFGSVALFLFLVQALTGMLLALNYAASPGDAYDSLVYIVHDIEGGHLIRSLHHWGASLMVVVVILHATQVFIYAAYKKPREVTWFTGVFLLLFVLSFGLTGYLLPWDNRAYWGTVVTTQIAGQVPWLGPYLQRMIGAERGVGVLTFSRFYALHALILPAITICLITMHVSLVRKHGIAPGVLPGAPKRKFFPEQVFKDTLAIFIAFTALFITALFLDAPLERMADPTDTSYVPRPEWYFLFLFQTLKLFRGSLESFAGVGLPSLAVAALLLVPFVDRSRTRSLRHRTWACAIVVIAASLFGSLTFAALADSPRNVESQSVSPQHQRLLLLTPDELAGLEYFRRENCQRCHNLLEGDPKIGPNLAALESRRSPDWMESHFRASLPALSAPQMNALVTFISKLTPPKAVDLSEAPEPLLAGAGVFVSGLCSSCHKVNGAGGQSGPSLNGLVMRRSRQWVAKHFQAPKVMSPGTIMPPYHFAHEEQEQLINYLFQLP